MSHLYDTQQNDFSHLDDLQSNTIEFLNRQSELLFDISTAGDSIKSLHRASEDADDYFVIKTLKDELLNISAALNKLIKIIGV